MDDLERRIERMTARAQNIDEMPLLNKMPAASLLFKDMLAFLGDVVQRVRKLEGRANG